MSGNGQAHALRRLREAAGGGSVANGPGKAEGGHVAIDGLDLSRLDQVGLMPDADAVALLPVDRLVEGTPGREVLAPLSCA